jgi:hypothetical protein
MFTYTTCADCGLLLQVTNADTTHEGCTPHTTRVEYLVAQWLAAEIASDTAEADRLEVMIEEIDSAPPRLCAAAGLYASWGWPLFPLLPKGHRSHRGVVSDGKHPATRHGFKDATTDADRIHAWWTRHPDHNIGLATGHAFDVIDIDVPKDGQPVAGAIAYAALLDNVDPYTGEPADVPEELVAQGRGLLPDCHGQVATASGGLHLYIEPKPGRGNKAKLYPGIDYRGLGGYVVAPPSTLGTRGRAWSWIVKPSPALTGVRR